MAANLRSAWASFYAIVGSCGAALIGVQFVVIALIAVALAASFLRTTTQLPLFVVAGAALGLLLVGIHNAWDTVTHIAVQGSSETE